MGLRHRLLLTALLTGLAVLAPSPAQAQIDWRADTVWTQLYLKGENARKEGKYSQAAGWLEQAVARAEGFGQLDERLSETLKLLQQIYLDGRKEEEADAIAARLAAIAAARPETAVDRYTRQTAYIDRLRSRSTERLNAADYTGAEEQIREALAVADSIQAFDREIRADLIAMLAETRSEQGDPTMAEQLFLLSLAYRLNDDGGDANSAIAATIDHLAGLHRSDADASARFEKIGHTIAARTDWHDDKDVQESLWRALHHTGERSLREGRLEEAQELLMAAHTQATRLDPTDERVGRTLDALGLVQWRSGTPEAAEPLFRRSAAILMEALGNKNPLTALPLIHLGGLARATERLTLADTAFSDAIKVLKRKKERGDTTLGTLQYELATIAGELGDPRRAEKIHREAIKTDDKLLGKDHPNVARDAYGLALHYLGHDKHDKAERYFLQAITIAEDAQGPNNPTLAVYLTGYAESLRAQSRDAEAQQVRDRVERMSKESGAVSP
ncbi:MAG TPA: tetratricopeptide repeat protein [Acidobacteriota bacterium]|nr:tetratricopeptide repeat protein [Acidobacteriota bacterium]